jgi:hypothetical protein
MKLKMLEDTKSFGALEFGTVFQIPGCPTLFNKIFVNETKRAYAMNLESSTTVPITNFEAVIPLGKLSIEEAMKSIKTKQAKHFSDLAPGDVFRNADKCAVYMKIAADNFNCADLTNGSTAIMPGQTPVTLIYGVFEEDNDGNSEKE